MITVRLWIRPRRLFPFSIGGADLLDVRILQAYLLGEGELDAELSAQADLNGDGRINAADLTLLKRGIISERETGAWRKVSRG